MKETQEVKESDRGRRWSTGMVQDKKEENSPQRLPQSKAKKPSIAPESNLPDIEESEEGNNNDTIDEDDENSVSEHSRDVPESQLQTRNFPIFQTEIDQDSNSSKHSKDGNKTKHKRSSDVRFKDLDNSSDKHGPARVSNESRVAHADESESIRTLGTSTSKSPTTASRDRNRAGSSKNSIMSDAKLDHKQTNGDRNDQEDGKSGSISQQSSKSETVSPGGTKISQMKCIHGNNLMNGTNVTENVIKAVKLKSEYPCMLCEITDEAERMAPTDSNRLMLEIVYPHEFYDRYSRARNSKKQNITQGTQREAIAICKPVKVTRKGIQPEKSWNRVPQATPRMPEDGGVLQYSGNIPEKRRKQEEPDAEAGKKEFHLQCQPNMNALVITENARGQKMVLKGLKGWIMRKREKCQNKMHTEIKQSLYQVGTLGMQFSLPDYNKSLHDRKPMSPRPVTCLTARSQDNGVAIRPSTNTLGPRQRTMPSLPRDHLLHGQSRDFSALKRDLTNISTRGTGQENSAKSTSDIVNSSQKTLESVIAKVMKVGLALPPIKNDVKTPVSMAQTPT